MKFKRYISKVLSPFLLIMALVLMFSSCEDSSDMDLYLSLNNEKIELESKAGSTHIMVYSTGDWTVEFSENVDWISVDKLSGSGNSSVVFTYSYNFGLPRTVDFLLKRGDKVLTMQIVQKGESGIFKVKDRRLRLPKTATPVTVELESNVIYDIDKLEVEVIYDDETSEEWISDIKVTDTQFDFYALENRLGEYRSARVIFSLVDGAGRKISDYIDISQSVLGLVDHKYVRGKIEGAVGNYTFTNPLEGIQLVIISDAKNPNMGTNPNLTFNTIDFTENDKTAYGQSKDGMYGYKIMTTSADNNVMKKYQTVLISLDGLTLIKETNPERYTLAGLTDKHLQEVVEGTAANTVKKTKFINEITDADIHTFVTLNEIEIGLPYGAFMNVNHGYVVKTDWNTGGIANNGYHDAIPLSLRDSKEGVINMLTNAKSPWSKTTLPKGSGTIDGVIVHSPEILRVGDIGRYQIRVRELNDIKLTKAPLSKTLVEWNWFGSNGTNPHTVGTINKDGDNNVLPAIGTGKLYSTIANPTNGLGANFIKFPEGNVAEKGAVNNAMHYGAKWWNASKNEGEAFVFEFSTQGHTGNNFTINFSKGAGSGNENSLHNPTYWSVRYSTDGLNYTELPNSEYKVRPLNEWGKNRPFATNANIDHSFVLPNELLNQPNVYIKLQAKSNVCATATGAENGTISDAMSAINVRLGAVSFRYIP